MLTSILRDQGVTADDPIIVPDESEKIAALLAKLADDGRIDFILTTGGTGLAPRDVTPEATREVLDKEIPGLAEVMRHEGGTKTMRAYLSRGIAGIRGRTLIVNVPGSERGAIQSIETLLPLFPHALETIKGETRECGKAVGDEDRHHTH